MQNLAGIPNAISNMQDDCFAEIGALDRELYQHFQDKFVIQPALNRLLVSFQANKTRPIYRWYKYKEAFSASLVEFLIQKYAIVGKTLDLFAGSGTALFSASEAGIDADGIELLPIGQHIVETRKLLETEFTSEDLERLKTWLNPKTWQQFEGKSILPELRITKGAYSELNKTAIEQYLEACQLENAKIQSILIFALLCVLESISYTRKDGQYLRWDHRFDRKQGKKTFNEGVILEFKAAITDKISEIIDDLAPSTQQVELFSAKKTQGKIQLYKGSCLEITPHLSDESYHSIITSPPYCNRYDYTRTYTLELALLGVTEQQLVHLRQEMLSCTVENRPKALLEINPDWKTAIAIADSQQLLQSILNYLDAQKTQGILNNNGIPRKDTSTKWLV